ncbi:MAG: hypothetical protein AAFQ90_09990 [Pseudomonadota bacterium]
MISKNSRYADHPIRTRIAPNGEEVRYLRPALLRPIEDIAIATHHRVKDSDRIDILAAQYFGAAESWWMITAVSPRPHPDAAIEEPGDPLAVPALGVDGIGPR